MSAQESTPDRHPLHAHLKARGPITRDNPELLRLSEATGFSADHLYKIAIGARPASQRCLIALRNAGAKLEAAA